MAKVLMDKHFNLFCGLPDQIHSDNGKEFVNNLWRELFLEFVLMDNHFNLFYGLPDQIHADTGKEFVNNLWRELFLEFKIQHTTTPPYNPSSNPVERFHRTIIATLQTRGAGVQDNWDLWINASVFSYNIAVSSSTGVTQ